MDNDPAITHTKFRSLLGLARETTQKHSLNTPNPSRGDTKGLTLWERERALDSLHHHQDYDLAADVVGCSPDSVQRWESCILFRINDGAEKTESSSGESIVAHYLLVHLSS